MERVIAAQKLRNGVLNASIRLAPVGYDAGILNEHDFVKYRRFDAMNWHDRVAYWFYDEDKNHCPYDDPIPVEDPELRKQAVSSLYGMS